MRIPALGLCVAFPNSLKSSSLGQSNFSTDKGSTYCNSCPDDGKSMALLQHLLLFY